MNAKKIMGAVLVALLAAALFVGAGAAADKGTVFLYQTDATDAGLEGTWTKGAFTVVIDGEGNVTSDNFEAGTYKKGSDSLYVSYPTAGYSAIGDLTNTKYIIGNNGKLYQDSTMELTNVVAAPNVTLQGYFVTFPNGKQETVGINYFDNLAADDFDKGAYKVQGIFNKDNFTTGVSDALLVDTNSFTFTVVGDDDATVAASVDTVYAGEYITLTVEGTLGKTYYLKVENLNISTAQLATIGVVESDKNYSVVMPNTGVANIQALVQGDDEAKVQLLDNTGAEVEGAKVTITISKPVFTATLGAASYILGDEIEISGTSTKSVTVSNLKFNISGTNFPETTLTQVDPENGKEWSVSLKTVDVKDKAGKELDVGTYTIKIIDGVKNGKPNVVKTVAVSLKQPFISIAEAPEVVVQGTDAKFYINAEASQAGIAWYIFGTNFFKNNTVESADKATGNYIVELDDEFTSAENMSTGQYFAVFQHPMYDGKFNIRSVGDKFYLNTQDTATAASPSTELFDVASRQTANAAQALCDALDSQNIDDMYVKYSFFVVGEDESFTISDIPTEVVKGDKIVISGVDTANAEETVSVEMISTAFAAVPKETVGSAAFIVATAEIAEDGTWEITLDTSDLNVDEYSLSVVINDATKKNVKINVVEAADKPDTPDTPDVPDTPDTPDTPTEPTTPGFGALAALAGLGAVAVLLLRRE